MAENEFQIESMGSIYAQSLINEAQKQNALAEVTEDVRGIGQLLRENKAFLTFTQAVTISEDDRMKSLEKIFGGSHPRVHALTLNVIRSMARRDRLMFLTGFVVAFDNILKQMSGHVDAELVTASQLKQDSINRVQEAIGKKLGKKVDLKVRVDPALIGGMMLTVGDTLIDASVATQLGKIRDQLKRSTGMKTEKVLAV